MDVSLFLGLETQVWESLRSGDYASSAHLIGDDFLGVYPIGFVTRDEQKAALVNRGPMVAAYELHDARLVIVSDGDVLLCYRANSRPIGTDEEKPMATTYISSLWSKRGEEWLNVFSQDTTAV